ncbi:NTP transferase domain-containing protein [Pseudomonas entomophila]|uniref:NTP transferase domain-containing protein n=1 Tax=Pseudomonas entomophila TaxID=312306 RepID=UPI0023D7FA8A|nr:NTP transferase domain-containing protein [Pseudomonas entomophila]MDF0729877.1 NTP transferase domain-containing protein [Pseudomonas entomophila]
MQNVTCAVIAAAGMGTRIGLGMPKCMIEIDGKTILTRLIEMLRPQVDIIKVVVGYREDMVIEHCAQHHRDVVLVRNKEYRTTNTAFSFDKGAKHTNGKIIYIDGDLIISPESLYQFIAASQKHDILVGLTDSKSENAVFADYQHTPYGTIVEAFTRTAKSPLEWANVVSGPSTLLTNANGYVYERLEEHLPLPSMHLELAEVDTANDLIDARKFVTGLDQQKLNSTKAH